MKTFFLQIWRMGYKKICLCIGTDFKKCKLDVSKSAPKKVLAKKLYDGFSDLFKE
jgi:hypothetical protein